MSEIQQKTDAERIAALEKTVEAQGLALNILGNFVSSHHDLFGVYVNRELQTWMHGVMRSHGANHQIMDDASQRHDRIRNLLNVRR